tara:strand:+ start:2779 stop:3852 length:1074 start_codon:yes stop_codon:yes gene_type:complete
LTVQRITLRRGTAEQWTTANPILAFGELGVEIRIDGSTGFKLGDNATAWADLPYFESGSFSDYLTAQSVGQPSGLAELDVNGQVPITQLANATTDAASAISAHNLDTTSVHGIADTSALATKEYVDSVAAGIVTKPSVEAATTENLSSTYDNGTLGVGATLTSTTNGIWPGVDGITSGWVQYDGILVKDQTNAFENGRYVLLNLGSATTPWVLRRCSLCDTADEIPGMYIFVKAGSQAGAGYVALVADPNTFTVGVDYITMTQFAGGLSVTGGVGILVSGTQISIDEAVTAKLSSPTFSGTVTAPTISSTNITASTVTASLTGTASNASKIDNRKLFVQASSPTSGMVSGDIWIKTS